MSVTPTVLVVDDLRHFPFPARYARTSKRALALLARTPTLDELWLDHDLGGSDTTIPVVDWLAERAFAQNPYPVGQIYVHTANPAGATTIVRTLQRWDYSVSRIPAPIAPHGPLSTSFTWLSRRFWQLYYHKGTPAA